MKVWNFRRRWTRTVSTCVFTSGMDMRVAARNRVYSPDVMGCCNPGDGNDRYIIEPCFVAEALSLYDRVRLPPLQVFDAVMEPEHAYGNLAIHAQD